jgi:diamine N-acetyltransferase
LNPATTLLVRPARISEAGLVADISRETFFETFAGYNRPEDMDKFMNEQFTREQLIREFDDPDNTFLLAFEGSYPVGYVKLKEGIRDAQLPGTKMIEIGRFYVIKSHIGKGVGHALMQKCLDIARDKKQDFICLGVWEKNLRAIRFYNRYGFERTGTHEFLLGYDKQTDWLMRKRL